jgi:hypothetical protein
MPTFETPEPVAVSIELGVGDIRITAGERADTTVEVHPGDPARKGDVTAARETRVEYAGGRLLIKAPKGFRRYAWRGGDESITVRIELPAGSHVRGEGGAATLRCTGQLGECRFKTGAGAIHVEQAGPVELRTGAGDVTVDRAVDRAEIATGSGRVEIGTVEGSAAVKNANGDTWIGEVTGELRASAANGGIAVDRPCGSVAAKTANGDVRLGAVAHGPVVAETGLGRVEIGVRDGVAAWLDLNTKFGTVRNDLEAADRPAAGDAAVEIRARTAYGDITIRRTSADRALAGER